MSTDLKGLIRAYQGIVDTCQHLVADLQVRVNELESRKRALSREYDLETERLGGIARELRISLTALKGGLYILLHEEATEPETRRSLLIHAYENAERIVDLIRDFMDSAR